MEGDPGCTGLVRFPATTSTRRGGRTRRFVTTTPLSEDAGSLAGTAGLLTCEVLRCFFSATGAFGTPESVAGAAWVAGASRAGAAAPLSGGCDETVSSVAGKSEVQSLTRTTPTAKSNRKTANNIRLRWRRSESGMGDAASGAGFGYKSGMEQPPQRGRGEGLSAASVCREMSGKASPYGGFPIVTAVTRRCGASHRRAWRPGDTLKS